MSFQEPWLLLAISWTLMSKKVLLVVLTNFLKDFQSLRLLDILYLFNVWLHSLFHHCLEYFIILVYLTFFFYAYSILDLNRLTRFSNLTLFVRLEISRFLMTAVASLTKVAFSSLFFGIESLNEVMYSLAIGIVTVREVWSDDKCQLGWILSLVDLLQRNIRSITKLASLSVLEYLVGVGLVRVNKFKLKESATVIRSSLIKEWWGNNRSHKLSLILKSLVIMNRLLTFTSVSLRYFKTKWEESE